ncbi:MAG: T9SS type A sorting domain-containing protein [Bacteroidales bacterium]
MGRYFVKKSDRTMNNPYPTQSLILCMLFILLSETVLGQPDPALVYPDENDHLVYVKHANTQETNANNIIIDYSNCGFMGGGIAIPDIPVRITLYPQFGDDQERIQAAIDSVSGLVPDINGYRGAVLLKAGTYDLGRALLSGNDALQIRTSGVILRGEGQGTDGTILKTSFETKHQIIATRPERPSIATTNKTKITDPYVGSGRFGFHVEDITGFAVGDTIFVRFTPNQTWLDEIYANHYLNSGDLNWTTSTYTINYERIITHIEGDSITIHSPVILPMQMKFGGGEIVKLSFSRKRLHNVGVEHMRLIGTGNTATCPADDPNRLQTAVHYEYTENSWIRGITVLHTSNSLFKLWDSHYITAEDCASIEPLGPKRAGYRYTFYIDAASSHNLCQRTYTDNGRHDYVLGPRIPGPNVFLDGVSERGGTQGPHQRWATGTLFDNLKMQSLIALEHRGTSGSGHSWAGIQSIIWNTESPSIICDAPKGHMNYAIGNTGTEMLSQYINNTQPGVYRGHYDQHGTHVTPRSLYLKQLECRLGTAAVESITIPEQQQGTIYPLLNEWKGSGKITSNGIEYLSSPENLSLAALETGETSQFIELKWTDNVPNETQFILERSSDGGTSYVLLATIPSNTKSYKDENIAQATYHYRLKAVSETLESNYIYLFVDMFDEAFYANITFNVNMRDETNLYQEGSVWLVTHPAGNRYEMNDEDKDSVYSINLKLMVGRNMEYSFSYQNGPNPSDDIVTEQNMGDCANIAGYRHLIVPSVDLILDPFLFGTCSVAKPPGIDVTDLDGTIIFGSNDDEPWIDGENGAGSPPNEGIEMLIDNDINTKYLVRAVSSWLEVKTNKYTKLTGYTITSANDSPSRDPRDWRLRSWDNETERWVTLHTVTDHPVWDSRFKIKVWTFENDNWYHRYRLYITGINGDDQGLMQMAELELFGEVGDYTAVDISGNQGIKVYPNPARDYINIEWTGNNTAPELALFDITGRKVKDVIIHSTGSSMTSLNITTYRPGLYILQIKTSAGVTSMKIMIE